VKLLRADKRHFVFRLGPHEKEALAEVLGLYPCVPPAHHRLHRTAAAGAEAERQRLLDEALAEQRAAHRRRVRDLLAHPDTFRPLPRGWQFVLPRSAVEWLAQVLNDVRVGSWLALGAPEELPRHLPADPARARHAWAMELAGWFQMELLHAVAGPSDPA